MCSAHLIGYLLGTGNPASINLAQHDTVFPTSLLLGSDASQPHTLPYERLYEMLGLRDRFLGLINSAYNPEMQATLETDMQEIRTRLATIQLLLPPHLEFNAVNLRQSAQDRQDYIFVFLHLVLQSLIAMSHTPSLFRPFQLQVSYTIDVAFSAARTILDIAALAESLDPRAISANPFLDFPLAVAQRIFLVEAGNDAEYRQTNEMRSSRSHFAGISLSACSTTLNRLAE